MTTAQQTKEKTKLRISEEIICEIPRSETEVIRISYCVPEGGSPFIGQRLFYRHKETGVYMPTQKGFTVKPEVVSELVKGYLLLEKFLQTKK